MGVSPLQNALARYMPPAFVPTVSHWLTEHEVEVRITRSRQSKLGDYRSPQRGKGHRISINRDLNPYAFTITLIHEIAHLHTFVQYKNRVKPHGEEWKREFQWLMGHFDLDRLLPQDVALALRHYLRNPAASSCTDPVLLTVLRRYDPQVPGVTTLSELPPRSLFRLGKQRIFRKGDKLRTRYKCLEISSQRFYLINGLAEVEILKEREA